MQLILSLLIIVMFLWLLFNHPFKNEIRKRDYKNKQNNVREKGL